MEGDKRTDWTRGSFVGSGSFGTVSLAHDKSSGGVFAVKSVSLSSASSLSVRSLENEIEILKRIDSPYVVRYLGDDTTREEGRGGTCRNLHMEYMPGGTAADLAAQKSRLVDELDVRVYAQCVVRALQYLHGVAGVVHCDVKGRNVLLGRAPGGAKLSDFGSAIRIGGPDVDGGEKSWVRGTPLWMAPEVVRGHRPVPASDVWSLGCTIIEMATGARPWPDIGLKDTAAAMFKIGYSDDLPEFPAQMSKNGLDFLDKCLRRDAGERWTAEQLLRHPFLAEAAEKSPRSILDWSNLEFDGGDGGEEESNSSIHSFLFDSLELKSCARQRVGELCLDGISLDWNSCEGWEVVRRCPPQVVGPSKEEAGECSEEQSRGTSPQEIPDPCCSSIIIREMVGVWNEVKSSNEFSTCCWCCYCWCCCCCCSTTSATSSHCDSSYPWFRSCLHCELGFEISNSMLLIFCYIVVLLPWIILNEIINFTTLVIFFVLNFGITNGIISYP